MTTFLNKFITTTLTFCILFVLLVSTLACDSAEGDNAPLANLPPLYSPDDDTPETTENVPVESVEVYVENSIVQRGEQIIPTVIIYPANATDQSYTLHSFDDSVLRRTENGFVAIDSGYAEIIVTAANGATDWTSVTVLISVQRVSLDVRDLTLNVGESRRISTSIFPDDATYDSAVFSTSDPNIATISRFGTIQAIAPGSTEITFSVDGVSASISLTVEIPVTDVEISLGRSVFAVGDEGTFTVEFTPEDASNQSYQVSFGEGAEAVEGDGNRFSLTQAGEIEITITTPGGFSASETITVLDLEQMAEEAFELTNAERVDADLPALANMRQLRQAAQIRSEEIIDYFSHTRPDGRSTFTVLSQLDISYIHAGENIAMGQNTAEEVVTAWMNSQSHRENILRQEYTQIGIGLSMNAQGALFWAQMFMD